MRLHASRCSALVAAASILSMASLPALAIPTLTFTPASQTVDLGSTASVDVGISGLTGEYIGTYDFSVNWDQSLLALQSLTFGVGLDGPLNSLQGSVSGLGTINVFEVSLGLLANQDGATDFRLFTLAFNTLNAGTSALGFVGNIGPGNGFLGDELGNALQAQTTPGSITIRQSSGVPEPTAMALMALGLVGFLLRRNGTTGSQANGASNVVS